MYRQKGDWPVASWGHPYHARPAVRRPRSPRSRSFLRLGMIVFGVFAIGGWVGVILLLMLLSQAAR